MALILGGRDSKLFYWLHDYWEESADQRTKDYFLVDISATMMTFILFLYVLAVTVIIPLYMRYRTPYDLKRVIIGYDILLVLIHINMITN